MMMMYYEGSAIIQIRGRPFKTCLEWNVRKPY